MPVISINNLRKSSRIKTLLISSCQILGNAIQPHQQGSNCWLNVVGSVTVVVLVSMCVSPAGVELHESGCAVCAGVFVAVKPDAGVCPQLSQSSLEDY